jgi:hypothetical protein
MKVAANLTDGKHMLSALYGRLWLPVFSFSIGLTNMPGEHIYKQKQMG